MNMTKNIGFSYIIELVAERILDGEYTEGERIPSVREMAVLMQVAPNTVVHAYERLGSWCASSVVVSSTRRRSRASSVSSLSSGSQMRSCGRSSGSSPRLAPRFI